MHHLTRRGVSGSRLDRNRYARQLRSFTEIYLSKALGLARQAAIVFLRLYKVFQGEHRSREDEIRRNRYISEGERDHRICVRGHPGLLDEIKLRAECLRGRASPLSLSEITISLKDTRVGVDR